MNRFKNASSRLVVLAAMLVCAQVRADQLHAPGSSSGHRLVLVGNGPIAFNPPPGQEGSDPACANLGTHSPTIATPVRSVGRPGGEVTGTASICTIARSNPAGLNTLANHNYTVFTLTSPDGTTTVTAPIELETFGAVDVLDDPGTVTESDGPHALVNLQLAGTSVSTDPAAPKLFQSGTAIEEVNVHVVWPDGTQLTVGLLPVRAVGITYLLDIDL
jgi:hypothetical protein